MAAAGGSDPRARQSGAGMRRFGMLVLLAGAVIGGFLGGGFVRYTEEVDRLAHPATVPPADGIVVLTGGALRIDRALDLLKQGRGERLLISGVNPGTSAETLARMTGTDRSLFDCCVDLDYAAQNTVGNAEVAGRWARAQRFHDLILVTSDYHMPRSLREFDRISDIRSVTPYAVSRADLWTAGNYPERRRDESAGDGIFKLVAARIAAALDLSREQAPSTTPPRSPVSAPEAGSAASGAPWARVAGGARFSRPPIVSHRNRRPATAAVPAPPKQVASMTVLRSVAFNVLFYLNLIGRMLFFSPVFFAGSEERGWRIVKDWARSSLWLLEHVGGHALVDHRSASIFPRAGRSSPRSTRASGTSSPSCRRSTSRPSS